MVLFRFAPSPTGFLHLGSLRTVLFNHLLSRKLGGKWVLRIEDTDRTRLVPGAVQSLLATLDWCSLDYDFGPGRNDSNTSYVQSERLEIYNNHLLPLIKADKAYRCFCSPERLDAVRKQAQLNRTPAYDRHCLHLSPSEVQSKLDSNLPHTVRYKSTGEGLTQDDLIYKPIQYPSQPLEDFILRKSDGLPTYHFANVVDDHEMGITHVVRGEEWLPSTPKHLMLYKALSWKPPLFAHLPLLINKDGSKLSKRMGDVQVEDFIKNGYEPEALLNFVALMGWSRQAAVSGSDQAMPTIRAANFGASSAKSNAAVPVSKSTIAGQRMKRRLDPEEDVIDSDVMTLQELIDNFSLGAINKHRSILSIPKLDFLNRAHLLKKLTPPPQPLASPNPTPAHPSVPSPVTQASSVAPISQILPNEQLRGSQAVSQSISDAQESWEGEMKVFEKTRIALAKRLSSVVQETFPTGSRTDDLEYLVNILLALKERVYKINDVVTLAPYFFLPPELDSPAGLGVESTVSPALYRFSIERTIKALKESSDAEFSALDSQHEVWELLQKVQNSDEELVEKGGIKKLMNPLRHALTGMKVGAGMVATIAVLGKPATLSRLKFALNRIDSRETSI